MKEQLKQKLSSALAEFEAYLQEQSIWQAWPRQLAEASRYSLSTGGKRIRPCLSLLMASALGLPNAQILPWALAIEYIHTYSLIHDDLPAMDNDDFRRGLPTCHKKFDEATAILAGDALLTQAFLLLACAYQEQAGPLIALLGNSAGGAGMVGGQVEDIEGVKTLEALVQMQKKKTGALIKASILGAGICAQLKQEHLQALDQYGENIGLLFQLTDDILDAEQDAQREGNSFLHHLSMTEVLAQRDQLAQQAIDVLGFLGNQGESLIDFVDYICHRTH
jgi:geranylgeranyl diphosphate synthase type II